MPNMDFELRCAECGSCNELESEWDYDSILKVKPCDNKYCVIARLNEQLEQQQVQFENSVADLKLIIDELNLRVDMVLSRDDLAFLVSKIEATTKTP